MASNGFRPALLFLSSSAVSTTASISARKLSHGTSGSPFADKASKRAYRHRKIPADPSSSSAHQNLTCLMRFVECTFVSELPQLRLCKSVSDSGGAFYPSGRRDHRLARAMRHMRDASRRSLRLDAEGKDTLLTLWQATPARLGGHILWAKLPGLVAARRRNSGQDPQGRQAR